MSNLSIHVLKKMLLWHEIARFLATDTLGEIDIKFTLI